MRQRLLGAVVLASLAVILVPALLDFREPAPSLDDPLAMPPAPARHLEPGIRGLPPPLSSPSSSPSPSPAPSPAPSGPPDIRPRATAPGEAPAPRQPHATAQSGDAPPTPPERQDGAAVDAEAAGWVVQVGTFANPASAEKVRRALEQADLPVFLEPVLTDQGRAVRVRVGPVFERSGAEQLLPQVQEVSGLEPVVLSFP